jgi:hypothetical protein
MVPHPFPSIVTDERQKRNSLHGCFFTGIPFPPFFLMFFPFPLSFFAAPAKLSYFLQKTPLPSGQIRKVRVQCLNEGNPAF